MEMEMEMEIDLALVSRVDIIQMDHPLLILVVQK